MAEIHKKLMQARLELYQQDLKKTGENTYAGYMYFELEDFLQPAQEILANLGLCGLVSFTAEVATLTLVDMDGSDTIVFTSPMGSAQLKGCHEVQNIGAVESYQRRYLWMTALEIVESSALDRTTADKKAKATPTAGAWDSMDEDAKAFLLKVAAEVIGRVANDPADAVDYLEGQQLTSEEKIALWTRLDSKTRAALKKAQKPKETA